MLLEKALDEDKLVSSMASKAEEAKHIICSKCGAPLWVIKGINNDLLEYACLSGHVFTYKEKKQ